MHIHEHSGTPSRKTAFGALLELFSIPWCCVLSLSLAAFSAGGGALGVLFDQQFHQWLPVVVPVLSTSHGYGIYRYAKHPHKTRGRTVFLAATTVLFLASVSFHFTDLHDWWMGYE